MAPTLLLLLSLLAMPTDLAGQQAPINGEVLSVHPEARKAIDGLRSPYCPGLMLEVCPSPGGAMLRDSIQRRAERGMKAETIIEGVLAEYGEEWRAEPRATGTGLWAWLAPPLALLTGLGLVGWVLARRSREGPPPPPETPDPAQEARLREAMRELDESEEPAL